MTMSTPLSHCWNSGFGILSLPQSPKHKHVHCGQRVWYLSLDRGHFLVPSGFFFFLRAIAKVSLHLFFLFQRNGFFPAGWPLMLCWFSTSASVSYSILTEFAAVVLGLICTFHAKVRSFKRQKTSPSLLLNGRAVVYKLFNHSLYE